MNAYMKIRRLTQFEQEVLIRLDMRYVDIAADLSVSASLVSKTVSGICKKFDVDTAAGAALEGVRQGYIRIPFRGEQASLVIEDRPETALDPASVSELTEQDLSVLHRMSLPFPDFVTEMNCNERSAKRMITSLYRKMQVSNSFDLAIRAASNGYISLPVKSGSGVTLGTVWRDYIAVRKLKAKSLLCYRQVIRSLEDWFDRPIEHISKQEVLHRHAELSKSAPVQANLTMRVLRALMNFAHAKYDTVGGEPIITRNPTKGISALKQWNEEKIRREYLKPAELRLWFSEVLMMKDETIRDYLLLSLFTGLRQDEARLLRWENVDLCEKTLTVRATKNGEDHLLPLSDFLLALLKSRRERTHADSTYVFCSKRSFYSPISKTKTDAKKLKHITVPFRVHDLRRTFLTAALACNVHHVKIRMLANHKVSRNKDMTFRYLCRNENELREPMQQITDYLLKHAQFDLPTSQTNQAIAICTRTPAAVLLGGFRA